MSPWGKPDPPMARREGMAGGAPENYYVVCEIQEHRLQGTPTSTCKPSWWNRDRPIGVCFRERLMKGLIGIAALVAVLAAACGGSDAANTADKIAFARTNYDENGDYENVVFYTIDADGSGLTRLTACSLHNQSPVWSPDGSRVAVTCLGGEDGKGKIYLLNADGSRLVRLTNIDVNDTESSPAWSPDGARIAFHLTRQGGQSEIDVVNADGSALRRLTFDGVGGNPAWSPDGAHIAFASSHNEMHELFVMNPDGSALSVLARGTLITSVSWSPDGTQLAFLWSRGVADQPGARVFVINADGSGPTNLTNNAGLPSELSWSPDGTRLAFSSDRDGQFDVYVINVDGAGLTNLSNDPADDFQQRWSPDGTRLAFSSDRDGDFDIYIMNADGTGLVNLTNGPADEFMPAWSPAP